VETQRLIATTQGVIGFESFKERAPAELASTQAQYQATQDECQRRQLAVWIDYHQGFLEAESTLEVRVPNVAFSERLVLEGTQRSAELIPYEGGHGESDCVLFLPQEGILFMSDLLFIGHHPWLGEGDPDKLLGILAAVGELDPKALVPGHGPVGTPDCLEHMRHYVCTLDELAQEIADNGKAEAEIDTMMVPEPYDDWLFAAFFTLNMRFLYQRRLGA
jgi:glyoxylase-like metal-dependent hydrolase (beta-lactamase superfamily II)